MLWVLYFPSISSLVSILERKRFTLLFSIVNNRSFGGVASYGLNFLPFNVLSIYFLKDMKNRKRNQILGRKILLDLIIFDIRKSEI